MTSGKLLRQLVKAATEGNEGSLKDAVNKVIIEERQKQHHLLANDLEGILYGTSITTRSQLKEVPKQIPADKERQLDLLTISEPVRSIEDIVLSEQNKSVIDRVIIENNQRERLASFGIRPAQKILFYGPPGCGKSVTAEALAFELDYPLTLIRIDSVISSYLGETAANLRKVFEYIHEQPSVVLFDEFDALAKERSIAGDHGELKRVVNAFLQMIDAYKGKSVLVAATNHEMLLDKAIWRRFDETLEFKYPTKVQIVELLRKKLRSIKRDFDLNDKEIISSLDRKSHADIERILIRSIKDMILRGDEFLTSRHLRDALRYDRSRKLKISRS